MWKIIIFVVGSAGILWISWPSFRNWRSHGFYRFFAFESILILLLINVRYWLQQPLAPLKIIAWVLLTISLFLVIHGFYLLRAIGQAEGDIENTKNLVTTGAYKYIRHPLYSSLLFLAWGIFLKQVSLITTLLLLVATVSIVAAGKVEEKENIQKFGDAYIEYMKATKMFIPYLF